MRDKDIEDKNNEADFLIFFSFIILPCYVMFEEVIGDNSFEFRTINVFKIYF